MNGSSRGRGWNQKRGSSGRGGSSSAGPVGKRFRADDEDMDEGNEFDSQLAAMMDEGDELQLDNVAMMEEPEELVEDMEFTRVKRWKRPNPPQIDPTKENFVFQQIDIDNYVGKPLAGMPGAKSGPVPVMRMFGTTEKVRIIKKVVSM